MMRLYSGEGNLPFRSFIFPDGQRHIELLANPDFQHVTIEASIRNADELFDILLARDALAGSGKSVSLDIRYLLGGRMDRRINPFSPHTLGVVSRQLLGAGFKRIRVLDPHSSATLALLGALEVYPILALRNVLANYNPENTWILAPDAGATDRVRRMLEQAKQTEFGVLQGVKLRNPETGALSGFDVPSTPELRNARVLILDDICDGGGTFSGIAGILEAKHCKHVDLFVTHGVFSKSLPLAGIRKIYTTDSYTWHGHFNPDRNVWILPVRMQDEVSDAYL